MTGGHQTRALCPLFTGQQQLGAPLSASVRRQGGCWILSHHSVRHIQSADEAFNLHSQMLFDQFLAQGWHGPSGNHLSTLHQLKVLSHPSGKAQLLFH